MKFLKFIGCFIVITCVCMIPVVLGGAVPYTSDFGWGVVCIYGGICFHYGFSCVE